MILLEIILIFFALGILIPLGIAIFEKISSSQEMVLNILSGVFILGILYWIVLIFTDIFILQLILLPFGLFLFAAVVGQFFS